MQKVTKQFQLEEHLNKYGLNKKQVPVFLQIKEKELPCCFSFKTDKTDPIFKIDQSFIKEGLVLAPVIQNPKLYPFSYIHTTKNGEKEYAQFGNYVGFEVAYQKLHIAKVIQYFGIAVLRNDERYLETIIKEGNSIDHLYIYDFKKQSWTKATGQHQWNLERDQIDKARRNEEVIEFFNEVFQAVDIVSYLDTNYKILFPVGGKEELKIDQIIERFLTYFEFFYTFGEISHAHIDLIRGYFKKMNENIKEYQALDLNQRNSKLMTLLKKITFEEGGWVKDNQFFPNFAYFFSLSQPAKQYRSQESIREKARAAIAYSHKIKKQEVIFNDLFIQFCRENNFHI
jgi:hypothetical protein